MERRLSATPAKYAALALLPWILAACTHIDTAPKAKALAFSPPQQFSEQGTVPLKNKWWLHFNDPHLNQWVKQGLEQNYSLSATWSRLQRNRLAVNTANDALLPSLRLEANQQERWRKDEGASVEHSADPLRWGVSASWEIDLWGKLRKESQAARWDHAAGIAGIKMRSNTVAANVAQAWYDWLTEIEKQRLLHHQYTRTQQTLDILERRFLMGSASIANIWRQRNELDAIQSEQIRSISQSERHERELALWLGLLNTELPSALLTEQYTLVEQLPFTAQTLPDLPPLPNAGIPIETLAQRPDIQQAYANLQGAHADVAIAIRDRFPRLTLNGSSTEEKIGDLFSNWAARAVGSVAATLAQSGLKRDAILRQKANLAAETAEYQDVWLNAIKEVEDILSQERQLAKSVTTLNTQLQRAREIEQLRITAYMLGNASYIELLNAQESTLNLERRQIDLRRNAIGVRIRLYRALSHGDFYAETLAENTAMHTHDENNS